MQINSDEISLLSFSSDQIFIGVKYETPAVGKIFAEREDYLSVVQQVKGSGEFLGLTNKTRTKTTITLLRRQAEIDIVELKDCVSLSVWLRGRNDKTGFFGLTDAKGLGFLNFVLSFNHSPSIVISLICNETKEETLVYGIRKVNLKTLQ